MKACTTRPWRGLLLVALAWLQAAAGAAAAELAEAERARIDAIVADALKAKGVPGASVALVIDGRIAYVKAYGLARVAPEVPATPAMRFAIGSVSKQFTAAGLLMLEAEGRLSLDEPVRRWLPDLGPAGEATLRQLLSHTAGLRDFYPQDYQPPEMSRPVERAQVLERWARRTPDFAPGTRWQYSNTGYAVAGAVLEKVSGQPLFEFLQARIFGPLGMRSVIDLERRPLDAGDAAGHVSIGLGPPRPAPPEHRGWMFGAFQLAMTAEDLARWVLAMDEQRLMPASAWRAMATDTRLADGSGTRYGLGVGVRAPAETLVLKHDGAVAGFLAQMGAMPGPRAGWAVLTNGDGGDAAGAIAGRLEDLLLFETAPADRAATARDRALLEVLREGRVDRARFSDNGNVQLNDATVAGYAKALREAGPLKAFELNWRQTRGGMDARTYRVELAQRVLQLVTRAWPDGRLEQFLLTPD